MTTNELLLGPLVGSLSHDSVKIWARAPGPATLYAWLSDKNKVKRVGKTKVDEGTSFAGIVEIKKLKPETEYGYALSLANKKPPAASFQTFKTAPVPGQTRSFSFAFGSCFLPCQPEPGLTFQRMQNQLKDLSFMLMIGDQIYADIGEYNGLGHIAMTRDDYREVYRHTWSNRHMRDLLKNLPVFMTLDDHEVDNDWHWKDRTRQQAAIPFYTRFSRWRNGQPPKERVLTFERARAALQAYWEHQGMHGPEPLMPGMVENGQALFEPEKPSSFAYTFTYGSAAFFVMDTRTMRMRKWYLGDSDVLGVDQWHELKKWLIEAKDKYPLKFLVTSSALLHFLIGDYALDRWSGYPRERDRLLYFIQEQNIEGVHLLTGDLHSGHAISVDIQGRNGKDIPLWEFCASPFEQHPNRLAWLLTYRWPFKRVWKNYKVHFVKGTINYGIVNVNFDDLGKPKVGFELHYLGKDGKWGVKSVPQG